MQKAKIDDTVKVHYTGKLADGTVFDSSEGRDPLEFKIGSGMMIPGFDKAVQGLAIDESKLVEIPSAEAYGEMNPEMIQEVSKSQLPPEMNVEVGMQLMSQHPSGQEIPLIVTEVKEESIVVDANHPLAGKDLTFDIKLVSIG